MWSLHICNSRQIWTVGELWSKWLTFTLASMEVAVGWYNLQTQFIFLIQHYLRHSLPGGSQTSITLPSSLWSCLFAPGWVHHPSLSPEHSGTTKPLYIWTQYHSFDFLFEGIHWSWREQTDGIEMRLLEKHSSKICIHNLLRAGQQALKYHRTFYFCLRSSQETNIQSTDIRLAHIKSWYCMVYIFIFLIEKDMYLK